MLTLHIASVSLPTLNIHIQQLMSHLCGAGTACLLTPRSVALPPSAAVCVASAEDVGKGAVVSCSQVFMMLSPVPSVRSACALVSVSPAPIVSGRRDGHK